MKVNRELYKRISTITGVDYSGVIVTPDEFYIEEETIKNMILDLICKVGNLEERLEENE